MALYAFDGTWNRDEEDGGQDTNVVRFREVYGGADYEYLSGVGTRMGTIGRIAGGLFGLGGRTRIDEMRDALVENWNRGDRDIDIVGFSRGAALAVHFANELAENGLDVDGGHVESPSVRFLGLWDVVGSFGLSFDTLIDFQSINLGWDIDRVAGCVACCCHAMALDERRETFDVTRLDPDHRIDRVKEVWFRGVHGDVGGGNGNVLRSNIAFQWMVDQAREAGVPLNEARLAEPRYSRTDPMAKVSTNRDPKRDPRREVRPGDTIHPSARPKRLAAGERHECDVRSAELYNWSGVEVEAGGRYRIEAPPGETWLDGGIECGARGWETEQLPWAKEKIVGLFERWRRVPSANWFELIGALGDEDDELFRIGQGSEFESPRDAELWMFANDLASKYDDNEGSLRIAITRIG